jgi:hypothetical protein
MARRSSKWVIHERSSNNFELSKGNRGLYFGMRSKQEALQRLITHYKSGEIVMYEEPDGYLANITEQLRKSGIIS